MSSCGWMVASPPRWHGPQVRAPEHHGGHGAFDVVGPVAPARSRERPWVCRSVHRSAKMASRRNHRSHAERALWSSLTRKMRLLVRPTRRARLSVRVTPQSASLRESPGAEWGTCARCCDAIRRGVNPHKPPKSLMSTPIGRGVSGGWACMTRGSHWSSSGERPA